MKTIYKSVGGKTFNKILEVVGKHHNNIKELKAAFIKGEKIIGIQFLDFNDNLKLSSGWALADLKIEFVQRGPRMKIHILS